MNLSSRTKVLGLCLLGVFFLVWMTKLPRDAPDLTAPPPPVASTSQPFIGQPSSGAGGVPLLDHVKPSTVQHSKVQSSKRQPTNLERRPTDFTRPYIGEGHPLDPVEVTYVRASSPAEIRLKHATVGLQTLLFKYRDNNSVLNSSKWRGRMADVTGKLFGAAWNAQNLPSPPADLRKYDELLRQAGAEYQRTAELLAAFVIERDDDKLGKAAHHEDKAGALLDQSDDALREYLLQPPH